MSVRPMTKTKANYLTRDDLSRQVAKETIRKTVEAGLTTQDTILAILDEVLGLCSRSERQGYIALLHKEVEQRMTSSRLCDV